MEAIIINYLYYLTDEDKEMLDKMRKCNHLFVKFEEGRDINLGHSSDCYYDPPIIQCVCCGLTNKHINEVEVVDKRYDIPSLPIKVAINSEFRKQFKDRWVNDRSFIDGDVNYISNGVLKGANPYYWNAVDLYNLAKDLVGEDANNDLIFDTMKQIGIGKLKVEMGFQKTK